MPMNRRASRRVRRASGCSRRCTGRSRPRRARARPTRGCAASAWCAPTSTTRRACCPSSALHRALVAFAEVASREAIPRAWKYLVAPDSLGVWVRVLRGTTEPAEAFARLDAADSQYGRTTRWETHGDAPRLVARARDRRARSGARGRRPAAARSPGRARGRPGALRLPRRHGARDADGVRPGPAGVDPRERDGAGVRGRVVGARRDVERRGRRPRRRSAAGAVPARRAPGRVRPLRRRRRRRRARPGALGGRRARARPAPPRRDATRSTTRVHALERSLSLRESHEGRRRARSSRARWRRGSTASCGGWARAPRASSTRRCASRTGSPWPSSSCASPPRTTRWRAIGCVARPRRWASSWHPNVVEVIDHGHLPDGTAYLVMELLPGESLATRLRNRGRLTPRELLPIAMQMCDALAAVHAAGVVHRDVKPSNILLAVDRDDPAGPERVKLLDFGIARVEWEETRITNTGGPLGTPGYMSPEQEIGEGEIDGRSDLFSLGRGPLRVPRGRAAAAADAERARSHATNRRRGSTRERRRPRRSCRRAGAPSSTRPWPSSLPTATPTRARSRPRCGPFAKIRGEAAREGQAALVTPGTRGDVRRRASSGSNA